MKNIIDILNAEIKKSYKYLEKMDAARTAAEIDALYNEFIAKIKGGE